MYMQGFSNLTLFHIYFRNIRSKIPGYFMLVCGLDKENGSRGCCIDLPGKGKWSIFEGGLGAGRVRNRIK